MKQRGWNSVYSDMVSNYTTDEIKYVIEKTSSNEKMQVMALLMELADTMHIMGQVTHNTLCSLPQK
jgi:hypothetical protein